MKKLMAANWKMYKTTEEAQKTCRELIELVPDSVLNEREVLIIPPYTSLSTVWEIIRAREGFSLGAQNFYPEREGAFTGEVSPLMLLDVGCSYGLVGHSERRHLMGEGEEFISRKVRFGIQEGLSIILCIGEVLEERKQGRVKEVLVSQLRSGLSGIQGRQGVSSVLSIAYEPVWAIGTGEVAGIAEIEEAHGFIREELVSMFGGDGENVRILYGGSVKPENASAIIGIDNVDGVLVGGASLKASSFSEIISS